MTDDVTIKLPKKLSGAALPALLDRLRAQNEPLRLDASDVARVGTDGAQLLVSAHKTWQAAGQALSITNASDAFVRHINDFALTHLFEEAVA